MRLRAPSHDAANSGGAGQLVTLLLRRLEAKRGDRRRASRRGRWLAGAAAACDVSPGRSHGVSMDLGKGRTLRDGGKEEGELCNSTTLGGAW